MLKQVFATLCIAAFLALVFSCQESSSRPRYTGYRPPSETQSRGQSQGRGYTQRGGDVTGLLRQLETLAARNPSDLDGAQALACEIEETAPGSAAAESAGRIVKNVRANLEAIANRKYKAVIDRARDLADKGRYDKAMQILEQFAFDYRGTGVASTASDERTKYARTREAKSAYKVFVRNANTFRAVREYDKALEYVKKQKPDKVVKGTPYEERMNEFISELTAEAKSYETEKTRIDALPWEDLTRIGRRSWSSDGGLWKVENGKITGANPNRDYGMFLVGQDNWKDFILEMRFTIHDGEFDLGIRGIPITLYRRRYKVYDVCSELVHKDRAIDIKVTVRGEMIAIESPSLPEARYMKILEPDGSYKHTHGSICIYLHRGARVEFSRLRIKHLAKVGEPTAER
jgi:predicted metal-dependent hydrolase